MPTLTALYTLSEIWALIYKSLVERRLTGEERDDLARLCELLTTIAARDDFNQSADEFRLLLQSCGVFEDGVVKEPEKLLSRIDDLRVILDGDLNLQREHQLLVDDSKKLMAESIDLRSKLRSHRGD